MGWSPIRARCASREEFLFDHARTPVTVRLTYPAARREGARVREVAMWIGRAAAYANAFPDLVGGPCKVRDAEGPAAGDACRWRGQQRKEQQLDPPKQATEGGCWEAPRMAALRRRVLDRIAAAAAPAQELL